MHRPTAPVGSPAESRAEWILDWMRTNTRGLVLGLVAVVVLVAGAWLWRENRERTIERSWASLGRAESALAAGNLALARSDLRAVVNAYGGTPAGAQAALVLAQIEYEEGNYEAAIQAVQPLLNRDDEYIAAAAHSFVGAAQEQLQRPAEAAASFRRAAELAPFESAREEYLNDAARAFLAAGNRAEAVRIWSELAEAVNSPAAAEARLRLGEVQAQTPAS